MNVLILVASLGLAASERPSKPNRVALGPVDGQTLVEQIVPRVRDDAGAAREPVYFVLHGLKPGAKERCKSAPPGVDGFRDLMNPLPPLQPAHDVLQENIGLADLPFGDVDLGWFKDDRAGHQRAIPKNSDRSKLGQGYDLVLLCERPQPREVVILVRELLPSRWSVASLTWTLTLREEAGRWVPVSRRVLAMVAD